MPKFYLLSVATGLFLIFTSCQKRHDPNNGTILRKFETNEGAGLMATSYVYDEMGRLVRLQIVLNPNNGTSWVQEAILMEFNDAGDLIRASHTVPGTSILDIEEFTHNNKGDTVRSLMTLYSTRQPSYSRQVVLDNRSRVISDSILTIVNGDVRFTSYTWDAAGNMATQTNGLMVNGILQYRRETTYTYDTHRNPFSDFGLPYYLVVSDGRAFNTNNVLTWTENNQRRTWQYTYNTSGLPLWSTFPTANGEWKSNFYYR